MNTKNAKHSGYQDGREVQRKAASPFTSKEEYILHGKHIAESNTRYIKTIELYVEGWMEAWVDRVKETLNPVIPHNPNTRFCSCTACMAE